MGVELILNGMKYNLYPLSGLINTGHH